MPLIYKEAEEHHVQIQVLHNPGYNDVSELSSDQDI